MEGREGSQDQGQLRHPDIIAPLRSAIRHEGGLCFREAVKFIVPDECLPAPVEAPQASLFLPSVPQYCRSRSPLLTPPAISQKPRSAKRIRTPFTPLHHPHRPLGGPDCCSNTTSRSVATKLLILLSPVYTPKPFLTRVYVMSVPVGNLSANVSNTVTAPGCSLCCCGLLSRTLTVVFMVSLAIAIVAGNTVTLSVFVQTRQCRTPQGYLKGTGALE
ncbi:trace amine-associated receptor 9-like [Arapaima gigas]